MQFSELQSRIDSARELDFGEIFNDSIELFKKVWVQGLLTVLLNFALVIPFIIVFYTPLLFFGLINSSDASDFENLGPLAAITLIFAYLVLLVCITVISVGLKAALFKIMADKDSDAPTKDDYFLYLRKPYLPKTFAIGITYLVISLIAVLLCLFPLVYAIVPLSLLVVVYTFNPELSTSELVNASFNLANKKWLVTFGLIVVSGLLAQMVGMLMCGIGLIFTASFAAIPLYFIYKKSIGEKPTDQLNQIGEKIEF